MPASDKLEEAMKIEKINSAKEPNNFLIKLPYSKIMSQIRAKEEAQVYSAYLNTLNSDLNRLEPENIRPHVKRNYRVGGTLTSRVRSPIGSSHLEEGKA